MPFVVRDDNGRIVEVHARASASAREEVAAGDPELRRFLDGLDGPNDGGGGRNLQNVLAQSDLDLIRVLEDLITVLIDKRIIVLTDLPPAAQEKLAHRYRLRSRLADLQGIVVESEEVLLP
ncbi:MAG: hypothetical protein D6826_01655 [Alphaproteobacteria bacterium]|nr:MAG: hypothetical protein D6826_01655 [Alphaproteobacteria bacterium]